MTQISRAPDVSERDRSQTDDIAGIREYLAGHPGAKAREAARDLGMSKTLVNHCLYGHPEEFEHEGYFWFVRGSDSMPRQAPVLSPPERSDPVLRKLRNLEGSVEYSVSEFEELLGSGAMCSPSPTAHTTEYEIWCGPRTGSLITCDSRSEYKMLRYLQEKDLALAVGGQCVNIPYETSFSTSRSYYPDIIVLTRSHHVAFIEVKSVTAMSCHRNIEKDNALSDYCVKHGFLYMTVDPARDFMSFEELRNMPVIPELVHIFEDLDAQRAAVMEESPAKPYLFFGQSDVDRWYASFGSGMTKTEFHLQVHSSIIRHGWYNRFNNGFCADSRPVLTDQEHNVTGWI